MSGVTGRVKLLLVVAFALTAIGAGLAAIYNFGSSPRSPSAETLRAFRFLEANDAELISADLRRLKVGDLNLPTGRVTGADPATLFGADNIYSLSVTPGKYPVYVYILTKDLDPRIALAEVRFREDKAVNWTLAIPEGLDTSVLKEGKTVGYGVDSGLGGFMSPEGSIALQMSMAKAEKDIAGYTSYFTDVVQHPSQYPSAYMHAPAVDPTANIAIFDTGWGDGFYSSYFGLDSNERPVSLVTTFSIVEYYESKR